MTVLALEDDKTFELLLGKEAMLLSTSAEIERRETIDSSRVAYA